MVFAADDLGAWLVGLLADAGRKKLITVVLGSLIETARLGRRAVGGAPESTLIPSLIHVRDAWSTGGCHRGLSRRIDEHGQFRTGILIVKSRRPAVRSNP